MKVNMPNTPSFFIKVFQKISPSLGLFVAPYQRKYAYVPAERVMKERIVQKSKIELRPATWNALDENDFSALAKKVEADGRTYLANDRLFTIWMAVRNVYDQMDLAAAEVGSFRGGSAYFIASAFRHFSGREHTFHIIDTFEGHPDKITPSLDGSHVLGKFADTNYGDVKSYLGEFGSLVVHKGEFSETIKSFPDLIYSLVHIDVDIYESTKDCLNYFGPRLGHGGVIIVDDYGAPSCSGVEKAVKEFLENVSGFQAWHPLTEQLVLIKV